MFMNTGFTGIIDRKVVREILCKWLSPQTAAQLIALGYDRETVREIFQEELTKCQASGHVMTYEQRRANLIEGLKMQTELGNWVKVAALADDLRVLEAKEAVCHTR